MRAPIVVCSCKKNWLCDLPDAKFMAAIKTAVKKARPVVAIDYDSREHAWKPRAIYEFTTFGRCRDDYPMTKKRIWEGELVVCRTKASKKIKELRTRIHEAIKKELNLT